MKKLLTILIAILLLTTISCSKSPTKRNGTYTQTLTVGETGTIRPAKAGHNRIVITYCGILNNTFSLRLHISDYNVYYPLSSKIIVINRTKFTILYVTPISIAITYTP